LAAKFDSTELILCCALSALVTGILMPARNAEIALAREGVGELDPLKTQYGPGHHSRYAEEWIVRDFFHDQHGGVFLDIGANDYERESNTYYLETALGWSGIAVDAQPTFAEGYRQHRPQTRFLVYYISDRSGDTHPFFVPKDTLVASGDRIFSERAANGSPARETAVRTITLTDLLDQEHVSRLDFLTMDIELGEPKALAGFDIDRFKPTLVCIEAHPQVRQAILDYFQQHAYKIVGKYLRLDTANLYFTPRQEQP
jgi:FkbM family methyltransferase